MSIQNFSPTLWSARLGENLDKQHVYGAIVNRDYEGEIKAFGDSVKINEMGDVTISDYSGTDITGAQDLTSVQKLLTIDQQKYFNFQVDDIDVAQANVTLMDKGVLRAASAMADVVDRQIALSHLQVPVANQIGNDTTPVTIDANNIYDQIVDLSVKLNEANVPNDNRFVVLPPFAVGLLRKSGIVKTRSTAETDSIIAKGYIDVIAGFKVYESNNVPNTTGQKHKIIAGHPMAITMAEQLVKIRAYEPEKRFADALKGLHVFGIKVAKAEALAVLTANK